MSYLVLNISVLIELCGYLLCMFKDIVVFYYIFAKLYLCTFKLKIGVVDSTAQFTTFSYTVVISRTIQKRTITLLPLKIKFRLFYNF